MQNSNNTLHSVQRKKNHSNVSYYYTFDMPMPNRSEQNDQLYNDKFNGMEKDDEVYGDGNSYTTLFRMNDVRLGRWWSVDSLAKEFPWQSPYISMNDNPINGKDSDGDRHIPINEALGYYGHESREKQLFPEPTVYQTFLKGLSIIKNIIDPSAPVWMSILGVVYENSEDAINNYYKDPNNADRKNIENYYNSLKEVNTKIEQKITEVKNQIDLLKEENKENGNTGFNQQEVASQTKYLWDLQDEQTAIQAEINKIEPVVSEPKVLECGVSE